MILAAKKFIDTYNISKVEIFSDTAESTVFGMAIPYSSSGDSSNFDKYTNADFYFFDVDIGDGKRKGKVIIEIMNLVEVPNSKLSAINEKIKVFNGFHNADIAYIDEYFSTVRIKIDSNIIELNELYDCASRMRSRIIHLAGQLYSYIVN